MMVQLRLDQYTPPTPLEVADMQYEAAKMRYAAALEEMQAAREEFAIASGNRAAHQPVRGARW